MKTLAQFIKETNDSSKSIAKIERKIASLQKKVCCASRSSWAGT